ncbi:MAG TPA: 2-oxoacid:ferredoxin oxidoreductase subunit beta [Saprospiraceae bacterium]|nr:2-oxoacid:ferredoxin oxidoreductase subunit beta [Saprospiraceae bacterium]HMQ84891.1 2-oxoacid:ferredoxin oxidoreductase subunit beta [Saprospiraceae bacterium]
MTVQNNGTTTLKAKDFASDQDVRWCPGCGDYSILKQTQTVFAELGLNRDEIAIVSGIGCSSRFPYYMETYGMHSIHGRAPAVACGLKMANPELHVWIVTGDGDGLSIGGNHFMHLLRRNFNVNLLMFNNQIYGLTKGQYSPTSEEHKMTKSTPFGSLDHPINPAAFALGSDATFVARSMDRDPKHLQAMIHRAHAHPGTSFLEIYQNCNIFNDGAFFAFTDKETKPETGILVEHGMPLRFGTRLEKGIRLDGTKPVVVDLEKDGFSVDDLWIHDEKDLYKAHILSRFFDHHNLSHQDGYLPRPFGVIYAVERPQYDVLLHEQLAEARQKQGEGDLDALIAGSTTWSIN